jgi:hypothetical protein
MANKGSESASSGVTSWHFVNAQKNTILWVHKQYASKCTGYIVGLPSRTEWGSSPPRRSKQCAVIAPCSKDCLRSLLYTGIAHGRELDCAPNNATRDAGLASSLLKCGFDSLRGSLIRRAGRFAR